MKHLQLIVLLTVMGCSSVGAPNPQADWTEHLPSPSKPDVKPDAEVAALKRTIAEMQLALAEAKKGGYTGCVIWTSDTCPPCDRLKADLKRAGWTVGSGDKFQFWAALTEDAEKHPQVPHLVYWNDGKKLPGEIVGYDGSEKSLAEIIAKHPMAHKKTAMAEAPLDLEIIYESSPIVYEIEPVPYYPNAVQWQLGPWWGVIWE